MNSHVYLEIFEKLRNEGIKASVCYEGFRVYRCFDCGHQWVAPHFCQSRLCTRCAERLHKIRVAKCLRKFGKQENWSHVIFTLPSSLWQRIDSWREVCKLRTAAQRIVKRKIGFGGVSVVHTFGSIKDGIDEESKWKPHVHLLVFNRKPFVDWDEIRDAWSLFLARRYSYKGKVNFYEKPFNRKRLAHRLRYVLRLPQIKFANIQHFAICQGKAYYSFFGKGVNRSIPVIPFTENLCPECGSKYVQCIARYTRFKGWMFVDGWDEGDLTAEVPK